MSAMQLRRKLCVLIVVLALTSTAIAQDQPIEKVLPTPAASGTELATQGALFLAAIELQGNTVLTDTQIADTIRPFLGRSIVSEELRELQQRLTALYVRANYINSRVIVPDQEISAGKLLLRAIEGSLANIRYVGYEPPKNSSTRRRLADLPAPLRLDQLQQTLRLIEQDTRIAAVKGQLLPGPNANEATLQLDLIPRKPYRVALHLDNHRSPSIGGEAATLYLDHYNLSGVDDHLQLSLVGSEGQLDGRIGYTRPIFSGATELGASYQRGDSEVVEATFSALDIKNDVESWRINLRHRLIDRLNRQIVIGLGATRTSSETELLDQPFSFSLGAQDGRSKAFAIDSSLEWIERRPNSVFAARLAVRRGLDAFDATILDRSTTDRATGAKIPDGRFTAYVGQLQYAHRLDFLHSQLVFNGSAQYSSDPLLSVEKIAFGGARSVRGYRENRLVRDEGVELSLEWQIPLWVDANGVDRGHVKLVPFVDYGRARDHNRKLPTGRSTTIKSAGLGVQWSPLNWIDLDVFWGHAFDKDDLPPVQDNDIQDDGWHFSLRLNYRPK
jgi:hemolysin activation/secretion protein